MIRLIVFTFCILCSVELFSQTAILRKDLYEQDNRTQNSTKGPGLKFYNAMFIRIGINHTIPKLDFFKTDISSIVHQSGLLGFGFYNQRKINQYLSLGINYGYQYKGLSHSTKNTGSFVYYPFACNHRYDLRYLGRQNCG